MWVSSDRRVVITAARSETDTCWFVRDSLSEGTRYGALEEAGSTDCDAGHPNLDVSDFRNEAVPTQNGRELTTPAKVDLSSSEG